MCPASTASSACPTLRTGSITTNVSASTSCSPTSSPPPYEPGTDQGIGPAPGARIELEIAALALALASVALTLCRGPPARAGLGEHRSRLAAPPPGRVIWDLARGVRGLEGRTEAGGLLNANNNPTRGLFEMNLEASSSHNHRHRANQTEQIICVRPTTGLRGQAWRKYSAICLNTRDQTPPKCSLSVAEYHGRR